MEIAEKIRGKGAELLRRLDQPLKNGSGSDLKDPRRGADTQTLSQTGQDPHDEFDCRLFAVEDRAMRLQKIPLARRAVELPPGATTGMTIGSEIAKPQPPPVITTGMRTKVHGSVDRTGTS